jgi:hypothetical protein
MLLKNDNKTIREASGGQPFTVWSFTVIDDLRPREEKG